MRPQPNGKKKKFHIGKGLRLQIYAWCLVVGVVMLIGTGTTYAWYSLQKREAETKAPNVMKPYYLNLSNPSETDVLQLSVGSLLQGKTKQIIFCVNTKEEEQKNKDTTTFEYELELVHTDNLALNYEIYALEKAEGEGDDVLIAEDIAEADDGTQIVNTTYWTKKLTDGTAVPLKGTDVSTQRHEQVGLIDPSGENGTVEENINQIINRGTYISYGKTENGGDGTQSVDNGLELTVGGEAGTYTSQYFVMEIAWQELSDYGTYDKETDMIYILAKVLQPKPTVK